MFLTHWGPSRFLGWCAIRVYIIKSLVVYNEGRLNVLLFSCCFPFTGLSWVQRPLTVQLVIIINIIFLKGLLNKCASGLEREQWICFEFSSGFSHFYMVTVFSKPSLRTALKLVCEWKNVQLYQPLVQTLCLVCVYLIDWLIAVLFKNISDKRQTMPLYYRSIFSLV